MSPPPPNGKLHSFSFGIADFTIKVNCHHSGLAKTLKARYADFPPVQTKTFTAQIDWLGNVRSSSLLDTKTNFKDRILHFSAAGYQGFIDEKAGQGHLWLSSVHPVEDIDYFLRVALALLAHKEGGVLLHTAGIVKNRQAFLFFGHSGSGKTTICRVSASHSSEDQYLILNDDLILLLPQEGKWIAHGTPFWNPTQIKPINQSAPVMGMFLLVQDTRVYTQKLSSGKATAALLSNVPIIPQDPIRSTQLLDVLAQLQCSLTVNELHFLPDNSFWDVIPG